MSRQDPDYFEDDRLINVMKCS